MTRYWKPTLFFVFALLIALLINMPVAFLLGLVNLPDNIKVFQPQGNLLSGRFGGVEVNQILLRDLEYKADLSCLLTFGLCYQVSNPYGSLMARFEPLSRITELTQVKIEFPLQDIENLTAMALMRPSGKLQLNLVRVLIDRDKLAELNGTLAWLDAGIAGESINLGDYRVSIAKSGQKYDLVIDDMDAVLDISGKGLLKADGKYSLDVNIRTRPGLESRVKNLLGLVARKKSANQYSIRRNGSLDPVLLSKLVFSDE